MRTSSCSEQAEAKVKCFFNDLNFLPFLSLSTSIFNKLEPLQYHFSKIFLRFQYIIPSKRVRIPSLEDWIKLGVVDKVQRQLPAGILENNCHTISENILENILGGVFLSQKFRKLTFRTRSTPKQFPRCY